MTEENVIQHNREMAELALEAIQEFDEKALGVKADTVASIRCWLREVINNCDEQLTGEKT